MKLNSLPDQDRKVVYWILAFGASAIVFGAITQTWKPFVGGMAMILLASARLFGINA